MDIRGMVGNDTDVSRTNPWIHARHASRRWLASLLAELPRRPYATDRPVTTISVTSRPGARSLRDRTSSGRVRGDDLHALDIGARQGVGRGGARPSSRRPRRWSTPTAPSPASKEGRRGESSSSPRCRRRSTPASPRQPAPAQQAQPRVIHVRGAVAHGRDAAPVDPRAHLVALRHRGPEQTRGEFLLPAENLAGSARGVGTDPRTATARCPRRSSCTR